MHAAELTAFEIRTLQTHHKLIRIWRIGSSGCRVSVSLVPFVLGAGTGWTWVLPLLAEGERVALRGKDGITKGEFSKNLTQWL